MKKVIKRMLTGILGGMLGFNLLFSSVSFAEENPDPSLLAAETATVADETSLEISDESTEDMSKEISEEPGASEENTSDEEASGEEASLIDVSADDAYTEEASLDESADASSEASSEEEEVFLAEENTDKELLADADPYSGVCGDSATWRYDASTKVLTISGSGAMYDSEITSPGSTYMTSTAPWFQYRSNISDFNISDNITYIGRAAFVGLKTNKKRMELPSKLTAMGEYAFYEMRLTNHADLVIPGNLKVVSAYSFTRISWGGKLIFQDGVETIGDSAFENASFQNSITWSGTVTTIGNHAFDFFGIGTNTDFTIPKSIKKIGKYGFYHIQYVRNLYFEGDMPALEEKAFAYNSVIAYYDPNNKTFSKEAREKANQYFGDVTWREKGYKGTNKAGDNITWSYDSGNKLLTFSGYGAIYDYSPDNLPDWFRYAKVAERYVFDGRITEIGDYAFYQMGDFRYGSSKSDKVIFPSSLKRIGKRALSEVVLFSVVLPKTVEVIDDAAFQHTSIWDPVEFPKGVKRIGDKVFYHSYDRFSSSHNK